MLQRVLFLAVFVFDDDRDAVRLHHLASGFSDHNLRSIHRDFVLNAGADDRGVVLEQWHGLLLHGAGHQGAVYAVFLYERNQAGRGAENLFVGGVNVGDEVRGSLAGATLNPGGDPIFHEFTLVVEFNRGVGDNHIFLGSGVYVNHFVGHFTVFDHAVGGFNKTIFVDTGIGRQVQDQTDVATFRGLYGTDAAVVSGVSVADVKAGAFPS